MKLKNILFTILVSTCYSAFAQNKAEQAYQKLYTEFQNPSNIARPRVWWHWMNGNVTLDGIKKDLTWMHKSGIGGFHNFDAGLFTPQVVEKRLKYMTPEWKNAFQYATRLADSLQLEMAIAGSPGWSESGGPWVPNKDGMKKLVWSEITLQAGKVFNGILPKPPTTTGAFQNVPIAKEETAFMGETAIAPEYYGDVAVIAYKIRKNDVALSTLKPTITSSGGNFTLPQLTDGDLTNSTQLPADIAKGFAWIQFEFPESQQFTALSIATGGLRYQWANTPAAIEKYLEVSNDGNVFTKICNIPLGGAVQQTISFSALKRKY